MDGAATTLHPCWEAYHLADEYVSLFIYICTQIFLLNLFKFDIDKGVMNSGEGALSI